MSILRSKAPIPIIVGLFIQLACGGKIETLVPAPPPAEESSVYAAVSINNFALTLKKQRRDCVLSYKNERENGGEEKSEVLDIAPPCNFIRQSKSNEVNVYSYGKTPAIHIVMIAGGPVFPGSEGDKFQPEGCGTEIQGVVVSDGGIEIGHRSDVGAGQVCPSGALEEVFYATVDKRSPLTPENARYKNARAPMLYKERPELLEQAIFSAVLDASHTSLHQPDIVRETVKPPTLEALNNLPGIGPDLLADLVGKMDHPVTVKHRFAYHSKYPETDGQVLISRAGLSADLRFAVVYVERRPLDGSVKRQFYVVSLDYDSGHKVEKWFDA